MAINFKDTLNLPKTDFPMRGNLVEREPGRLEHWDSIGLYRRIQEKNSAGSTFVLHDGPPFTNGDVHIGTALNKILKDIILRYKSLRGYRTPYVPGWDCHGLPIEHKVTRELREAGRDLEPAQLREACAEFSRGFIEKQRSQFRRLGVLADWEREYRTMNPAYEAEILRTFATFVEQGLVYRSKKPVFWSIPCRTALAEAEVEYRDHVSPSIWVAFPLEDEPGTHIVIWTTTPWTLPANLAVAVHPRLEYVKIAHGGKHYLVARELAASFIERCGLEGATIGEPFSGQELAGRKARHPFIERESPIVLAEYVTTESGTGCVHTAPGHGLEDYQTGNAYGLDIYCPLDDDGKYADDGQMPERLVGVSVLETGGKCPANDAVLAILEESRALLHHERYEHSYPHCWRSKTPIVFRAMDQWFVALDQANTRQKCLEAIGQVNWTPAWGENRIRAAVGSRPDWCISRQRSWGVPIPAFYDENGEALLDAGVIRGIAGKIARHGTNLWFEQEPEALLEDVELPEGWEERRLIKGQDTLDVWIDSGCSHRAVLRQHPDLAWPADIYLEGSDQHRGWFQSSLWTAMIADGAAPYKRVITHGFIVDESRKKISKSDGKPQTAESYVGRYGADIIRLWLSTEDYRNDIPISENILKQVSQSYRTLRNTLRFQLGNLYDFDPQTNDVPLEERNILDQWALDKTLTLIREVTAAYEHYEFHRVYHHINNFCSNTLSATYHDILKDRLYTYAPDWAERRSSQAALYRIAGVLTRLLAPILTFTADEAHAELVAIRGEGPEPASVHLESWPEEKARWDDPTAREAIDGILAFRSRVNDKLEEARQRKEIGQSLDAQVTLSGPPADKTFELLERYETLLPELFIVSQVTLVPERNRDAVDVEVRHAEGVRCPRSWRWVPRLVDAGEYGEVSPRDREALIAKPLPSS